MRKFLSFDIETAKILEGENFDLHASRPLGICCAAAWASDSQSPLVWHGRKADGTHAPSMAPAELSEMISVLEQYVANGYSILTWNGLSFDFDILAEESCEHPRCRQLAINHVDMMFHIYRVKGFRLGISAAASGMGVAGKSEGMTGAEAPKKWAAGQFDEVLRYVSQDCRMALDVAAACESRQLLRWISRAGKLNSLGIQKFLSVTEALKLPEPDTSWMSDPTPLSSFTAWLDRHPVAAATA